jgi:predicted  nucleic acid-binding Zn-ribbon protein
MSQPFKLYRLQLLDSKLDKCRARLDEIASILSDNSEISKATTKNDIALKSLEEVQKALNVAENNVKKQRLKIEQTEATLYGGKVRDPKELQELKAESDALKRYLNVLEDRQLEAMITAEDADNKYQNTARTLKDVETYTANQNKSLISEQSQILQEMDRMSSERSAAIGTIPSADLKLYNDLRKTRRGLAVTKITDKTCAACGTTLSTSTLHSAKSPSQITQCNTCNRILYGG